MKNACFQHSELPGNVRLGINSNQKLKKDIAKVRGVAATHRYVFFHCPGEHAPSTHDGVEVVPLSLG